MFVQLTKDYLGCKAGQRMDVSEKDGSHMIAEGHAVAVTDDLITPAVSKAMEGAFGKFTQALDGIIAASLAQFKDAQSQSRKLAVPAIFGQGGEGDTRKCFGDWLATVARAGSKNHKAASEAQGRLEKVYQSQFNPWQKAALAESGGTTGGYIVPPEFYDQLLQIAAEDNTFRQAAFVQPMASATLQFPYLDITTVQAAGTSPFFGGVVANWTEEAQNRTETEPAFKMMELKAHELSGYTVSSNVLLQDAAFGLEKFLQMLFGKAVAWYEEYAFLQGNGVGKPVGVINAPAAINVARNTSSHFYFPDVAGMLAHLLPSSYGRARWYISPTVVSDLIQLKDGANRAIFLSIDQGATKAPVWKLLNMPVTITEKVPALGTTGDVSLVDPTLYVIGDRMSLEVAASEHVNFLKNQLTWRFVQRIDGQPWMDKPVTLQDGTTQVSPFVVLQ